MPNEIAEATLQKIAAGTYTPEELSAFLQALDELDDTAYIRVYNKLYEIVAQQQPGAIDEQFRASLEKKLNRRHSPSVQVRRMLTWVAAAAVVVLIAGAIYWFTENNTKPAPVVTKLPARIIDKAPGGNHATLTLSNGATIVLDQVKDGDLAQQGGVKIIKLDSGRLAYYPSAATGISVGYNTITTPRAGQYHIILPDETQVWLNAASSLRFPMIFTGHTREVQLSGEGYFEVSHNASKPFVVNVLPSQGNRQGSHVEVLGTHFNINAYADEGAVKTTLLEGKVKVNSVMLQPGQQASILDNSTSIPITTVDVEQVIAWKNGFFEFNNMSLPAIMRQVSRWYDVDVALEAEYPDKRFGGRISRKLNLVSIVKMLETYGVHFNMENRKLIVVQ